jgi:hypothetical protein
MSARRPSVMGALLILILVSVTLVWWVNMLTNEDPVWFLRSFKAEADWIVVYWDGKTHMFFPGDQAYTEIMTAFSDGIGHWSGYEASVGLSDASLDRYRERERFLELHFNTPAQVHTYHMFPKARSFFVPLSGTHASYRRVFAGLTDKPRIGVLHISEERFSVLLEAIDHAVQQE